MQLKSVSGDSPDARLTELGFNLPPVPEPVADYLTHTQIGPIIYTSGMLHWIGGDLKFKGLLLCTLCGIRACLRCRVSLNLT